jgi:hypothetical protein
MLNLALQCWLCELRQEAPTLSQVEKAIRGRSIQHPLR